MSDEVAAEAVGSRGGRWLRWGGLLALAALHVAVVVDLSRRQTPTLDEPAHLAAGVSYWEQGTFKMYRLSPPLGRLIPSLAVLGMPLPRVYDRGWERLDPASHFGFAAEWVYAAERGELRLPSGEPAPMEAEAARQAYLAAFTRARLVVAVWSGLTLLLAFAWARAAWGELAGWVAAGMWACAPNIVGHASLFTTDLSATSCALLAAWAFDRWLARPTWLRASLAGVALAAALLIKLTLLWLPLAFVPWAAWRLRRLRERPGVASLSGQVAVLGLTALLAVDACYLFEGVGVPIGRMRFVSDVLTRPLAEGEAADTSSHPYYQAIHRHRVNRFRGTWLGALPCPLPLHFVEGWDEQKLEVDGGSVAVKDRQRAYPVYLRGELRLGGEEGWWYYYPYALLIKLPPGTWALVLLGLAGLWLGPRGRDDGLGLLWLAVFPVALVAMVVEATIGVRHVMSALPFLLLLGASAAGDDRPRWLRTLACACLLYNAALLAWIHPNELGYFSPLVGGSTEGRHHLADSNIDGGPDLRRLAHWLDRHPEWKDDVRLAYMGQIPPEWEGIAHRLAPRDLRHVPAAARFPSERERDPWSHGPQPGKFAVSVNFVLGLPFHTPCPRDQLLTLPRATLTRLLRPPPYVMVPARCYQYFGRLEPRIEPEIGYSILLFDVSLEQANDLRREMGLASLPAR